jgi:NAD-dependent SIR2 family protein deacetylase
MQQALARLNPGWAGHDGAGGRLRPDGDTELDGAHIADFRFPACAHCAGVLKPDVVFFGENVPAERVAAVRTTLAAAPALLVVGSSLMVLSGYRFVREALAAGKPVAVLNQGTTRADEDPILKLDAECGACLGAVTQRLGGARPARPHG